MSKKLTGEVRVVRKTGGRIPHTSVQYDVEMVVDSGRGGYKLHWFYASKRGFLRGLDLRADSSGPYSDDIIPHEGSPFGVVRGFFGGTRARRALYRRAVEIGRVEANRLGFRFVD